MVTLDQMSLYEYCNRFGNKTNMNYGLYQINNLLQPIKHLFNVLNKYHI